ncbi:FAD-dependent oxidoreductase [archaeon]|nr:MAG: FAD-dependent oxidoreductase [archaeon]
MQEEALFQFPMLKDDGLKGGIVYYDGEHNDTRMNVLIALTACQKGATVANYVEVVHLLHDEKGHVAGAKVRDVQSGKTWDVRAKSVINATGCFGDAVRKMDNPKADPIIMGAAGVHIILPDHFSPDAYVAHSMAARTHAHKCAHAHRRATQLRAAVDL